MVDMDAGSSVSGLKHPVDNNLNSTEIENIKLESYDIAEINTEAEEGQIIDVEFEDISSDEDPIVFTEADELSMRKRIEELELRNAELEKIAVISVINNYDLGSNKIVPQPENQPLDIIELSDYDEYSEYASNDIAPAFIPYSSKYNGFYKQFPKTTECFSTSTFKTYHKSRKRRRRARSSENKNFDENRSNKISRVKKRRKRSHSSSLDCSSVKLKTTKHHQNRSKRSKRKRRIKYLHYNSVSNDSDSDKFENYELNREELRKAVKRNSESISRGNLQNIVGNKKNIQVLSDEVDIIEIENDDEVKQINSKLNNENEAKTDVAVVASDDSDSLEEQTLRLIALKSAIVKKHLDRKKRREIDEKKPYSPSDFDYWCSGMNIENFPKDIDELEYIDSNNISPSDSPINLSDEDNANPAEIELINVDTDLDEPKFIDNSPKKLPSIDILKQLAPPPPQIKIISPIPLRYNEKHSEISSNGDESKLIISQKTSSPDDLSDEEELALRALLLSTMNSPKVNMPIKKTVLTDNSQNTFLSKSNESLSKNAKLEKIETSLIPVNDENKEDEGNKDLYEIIPLKRRNTNKAESLLKEAVKRLKTTTLNDVLENDQFFETNAFISENKTDRCLKNSVPDSINSFKEIQNSVEQNFSLGEIDSFKSEELLIESRKKLNRFIRCFNKENPSTSDYEKVQNSEEMSDLELECAEEETAELNICEPKSYEENIVSKSCIEALQKIIELNYEKLVKVGSDEKLNVENIQENESCYSLYENHDENINLDKRQFLKEDSNSDVQTSGINNKSEKEIEKDIFENNLINIETKNMEADGTFAKLDENKFDKSLEITKKIESLQKLSDSIEQTTKITAKAKASLDGSNVQSIKNKSLTSINRKIIKINKIINQTSHNISNHNVATIKSTKLSSIPMGNRKSPQNIIETSLNSNRVSKINKTTGKLIITVGVTSSSEDEDRFDELNEKLKSNQNIESQYDDNASPMSFQMDSPCYSPYSSVLNTDNSCNVETEKNNIVNNSKETLDENKPFLKSMNDVFQAKLDKFLKNARSQVELEKKAEKENQNVNLELKTPILKLTQSTNSIGGTPVAVRHLPESSQLEYRMLVNRMKILERQKQMKSQQINEKNLNSNSDILTQKDLNNCYTTETDNIESEKIKDPNIEQNVEKCKIALKTTIGSEKMPNINETFSITNEKELKHNTDLLENVNQVMTANNLEINDKSKHNLELLKKYEIAYDKNSTLMVENLNRALKFVTMGKEVKTRKVLLESKLEKLKAELKICESDLKLQNQKIAKIYPAISKSYDTIVHLKGRRTKLSKISKQLGKILNGNTYVLTEGLNMEIQNKFKHLSNEINYLKNLKITDIENNSKEQKENSTKNEINCEVNVEKSSGDKEECNNSEKDEVIADIKEGDGGICIKENSPEHLTQNSNQNETFGNQPLESTNKTTAVSKSEDISLNQEPLCDEPCINVLTESADINDAQSYEYISPLEFLNERQTSANTSKINPNEIVCPFELMGQCDDKDCKYNHLNLDCSAEQSNQQHKT